MIVSVGSASDVKRVTQALAAHGQWVARVEATATEQLLVLAPYGAAVDAARLREIPGVRAVSTPASTRPLLDGAGSTVAVGDIVIGGERRTLIAGPCAVESEARIHALASTLARHGVSVLRGGAHKPRTSPYAFRGHGDVALGWLRDAADAAGMKVVTEVLSEGDVDAVAARADLLQVGSRNMAAFALLRAVGRAGLPVLLKRGAAATIDEWLLAAEHLLAAGARGVVLCERGVRGFDHETRNLLDLSAVALLANVHRLPVIVDPSHATGRRDLVVPLARAALACGAAGVMVEVHDQPELALSDGPQALAPDDVAAIGGRS
ncbi:MAG: 3-deoxy-7-phosphoheptulonate synthase [Polyangiaceae bacterium]|nr:3-deoxy-7-phosphoheptulonate synthase [Polyangiaceae bacterium]